MCLGRRSVVAVLPGQYRLRIAVGGFAAVLVLAGGGCTPLDDALASVPFFKFMRKTSSIGPYEMPRPAPPGAVPFASPGGAPEPAVQPTQASLEAFAASAYGRNPLAAGEATELGQEMYLRYCMVCHGTSGEGNGPVVGPGKVPLGPSLVTESAAGLQDGYIFAVIKAGRSLMPPYGARATPHERWAIVNYVRQLQRAAGAAPPAAPEPADTAAASEPVGRAVPDTAAETTAATAAAAARARRPRPRNTGDGQPPADVAAARNP